ncbi:hypothetical protein HYPSUDRAFT_569671 [Hypholoma sublateritium FD-334 SS-4]|uniref:Uncharacterized protein n=1 Tax=Hypholoma sublateritium (strain FD-334 SS-4) TaxID=945553 RepID=A0A0D2P500_HYPSF|nr:hypothetical protein HYPSUDRAFT_569671 [Hypholoma sublateritium FD-334 SS-4]
MFCASHTPRPQLALPDRSGATYTPSDSVLPIDSQLCGDEERQWETRLPRLGAGAASEGPTRRTALWRALVIEMLLAPMPMVGLWKQASGSSVARISDGLGCGGPSTPSRLCATSATLEDHGDTSVRATDSPHMYLVEQNLLTLYTLLQCSPLYGHANPVSTLPIHGPRALIAIADISIQGGVNSAEDSRHTANGRAAREDTFFPNSETARLVEREFITVHAARELHALHRRPLGVRPEERLRHRAASSRGAAALLRCATRLRYPSRSGAGRDARNSARGWPR